MIDVFNECKQLIWLSIVAIAGAVVGFLTKSQISGRPRTIAGLLRTLFTGVFVSMFVAYISFEILIALIDNYRLCVALAGICAYIGADMLVIMQELVIDVIKKRLDRV